MERPGERLVSKPGRIGTHLGDWLRITGSLANGEPDPPRQSAPRLARHWWRTGGLTAVALARQAGAHSGAQVRVFPDSVGSGLDRVGPESGGGPNLPHDGQKMPGLPDASQAWPSSQPMHRCTGQDPCLRRDGSRSAAGFDPGPGNWRCWPTYPLRHLLRLEPEGIRTGHSSLHRPPDGGVGG